MMHFLAIIETWAYDMGISPENWFIIVKMLTISVFFGLLILGLTMFWKVFHPFVEKKLRGHDRLKKVLLVVFWSYVVFYVLDYTNPINLALWAFIFIATNRRKKQIA